MRSEQARHAPKRGEIIFSLTRNSDKNFVTRPWFYLCRRVSDFVPGRSTAVRLCEAHDSEGAR